MKNLRWVLLFVFIILFLISCNPSPGDDDNASANGDDISVDDDSGAATTSTTSTTTTTTTISIDDDFADDDTGPTTTTISSTSTSTTTTHTTITTTSTTTTTVHTTSTTTSTVIADDDSSDDDSGDDDIIYGPGDVVIGGTQGGTYYGAYIYVLSNDDIPNGKINYHNKLEKSDKVTVTSSITIVPKSKSNIDETFLGYNTDYPKVATDSSGNLHIIFFDINSSSIIYMTDSSGQWEKTPIITINRLEDLEFVMDKQDYAHLSYFSVDELKNKYAANITGEWSIEDGPNADEIIKLAVDSNEYAHFCYIVGDVYDRKLWYATNKSGTWENQLVMVPEPPPIPNWGSRLGKCGIAIDSNDEPLICVEYAIAKPLLPYGELPIYFSIYCGNKYGPYWKMSTVAFHLLSESYGFDFLLDHQDNIHLIYSIYSSLFHVAHLLHTTNASGIFTSELIDDSGIVDQISSNLDQNDDVHIAFYEGTILGYSTNASGEWVTKFIF